jgi:single-strand DNA-binding protein
MAGDYNRVTLIGRLGKDPEIRSFQNGGLACNFSMATSESWKDKNSGEKRERTQWHNITVHSEGLIGVIERFVKKGSKIMVEGTLENRKWQDKEGNDRWITEVVLRNFGGTILLLDSKASGDGNGGGRDRGQQSRELYGGGQATGQGGGSALDDSIPF